MTRTIEHKEALMKEYWRGFEDGKKNSLKHNMALLKLQLKTQKEFKANNHPNKNARKCL